MAFRYRKWWSGAGRDSQKLEVVVRTQEVAVRNRKWRSGLRKWRSGIGSGDQGKGSDCQQQEGAVMNRKWWSGKKKWWSGLKKWSSGTGSVQTRSGRQEKEVAVRTQEVPSGRGSGGPVVGNRKVLGVLTESVEMDQSQRRRRVIGFCAVGRWCQAGRL